MKNVDVPDHAGVTALHVASTRAEYCTKKLLEAGANPRATTHEDLTPLHLAVRAQESNVVGMLLRWLHKLSPRKSQGVGQGPLRPDDASRDKRPIEGIDAKDAKGHTPLYYAVRSGRPETVTILLHAGANVSVGGNLFQACSEFEEENAICNATCHVKLDPLTQREAKVDASSENEAISPFEYPKPKLSTSDTRRLEEIVTLLVSFGVDPSGLRPTERPSSRGIIGDCIWDGKAYTASCLFDRVPHSLWVEPGKSAPYSGSLAINASAYDPSLALSASFPRVMEGTPSPRDFLLFMR